MNTIQLAVTGMMCSACQTHVNHALAQVSGVEQVVVNLEAGKATVSGINLDVNALIAAVEEEGYGAQLELAVPR